MNIKPEYQRRKAERVKYRRGYRYEVPGVLDSLVSVTTYLNVIDKSGPLVPWARKDTAGRMRERLVAVEADRTCPAKTATSRTSTT